MTMPRLRVGQTERRRVAQACESCRQRKEKCDNKHPCGRCAKRKIECIFASTASFSSIYDSSSDTTTAVTSAQIAPIALPFACAAVSSTDQQHLPPNKRRKTILLNESVDSSDAEVAIDSCLNSCPGNLAISVHTNGRSQHNSPDDGSQFETPVPRVARLLRDGRGKFVYIGDSASLSFLKNVRRIVLCVIGECELTRDRLRHSFFERLPENASTAESHLNESSARDLVPTSSQAEMLANQYLTATACLLDLFDSSTLFQALHDWTMSDAPPRKLGHSILYLVMAIGAQVTTVNGWTETAGQYFERGRQLAFLSYADEPSLQTVQAFVLISHYMLGDCRRNAAFLNLGMAVRAAYALGLHRGREIHTLFLEPERQARDRVWQSLRVIDGFLSASLGRPSATSDYEKDSYVIESAIGQEHLTSDDTKFASSTLRLVSLFERILNEVYRKRGISTEIADDISRQYREWTLELPYFPLSLTSRPTCPNVAKLASTLAAAHLMGAYHWSIILLTRPFLILQVTLHHRERIGHEDMLLDKQLGASTTSIYAEASIDSAIQGVDIGADLITYPDLPKRLPYVVNSVFNSALAIGLAFFGDYDRTFPLVDAMEKADQVLSHMSVYDPQARRLSEIIRYLSHAAKHYVESRDRKSVQSRRQKKNALFGNIGMNLTISSTSSSGTSPTSTIRRDSQSVPQWKAQASGSLFSQNGEMNNAASNMTLTSPESREHNESIESRSSDILALSTSGFVMSTSISSRNNMNVNSSTPGMTFDFQDISWNGGDNSFEIPEMIPMFNLFSESTEVSPTSMSL